MYRKISYKNTNITDGLIFWFHFMMKKILLHSIGYRERKLHAINDLCHPWIDVFFFFSAVSSVIEYFKTHVYDQAIPVASFQFFFLPDGSGVVGK